LKEWLPYAIASLTLWGLWGLVLKVAQRMLGEWYAVYVSSNLAVVVGVTVVWLYYRNSVNPLSFGGLMAFVAGSLGTLGYAFLVLSLEKGGPASIVIPLTALYPAVTAILAVLVLNEHISPKQALGVALAIVAIYLMS
jgi:transporter family protein